MEKGTGCIGCIVMASGEGRRFGGNKLLAEVEGRSLIRRALEAVPGELFAEVAVVSGYPEILRLARSFGFQGIENHRPESGVSRTIRLGLEEADAWDGALFLVSDQPYLRRESVAALVRFWREAPACIAALACHGVRGNPCLFPARFFPELRSLRGDHGGSAVIRQHESSLRLLEAPPKELQDIDIQGALL